MCDSRETETTVQLPPCLGCGKVRCVCDRAGNTWARKRGVRLPSERDTGRLLGNNYVTQKELETLVARRDTARAMREYLATVRARIDALDRHERQVVAERRRLHAQAEILALRYEGEGMGVEEIAKVLGRKTPSWATRRLKAIRAEARGRRYKLPAAVVVCQRPGCGRLVLPAENGNGAGGHYCEACRRAMERRRVRAGGNHGNGSQAPAVSAVERG